MSIALIEPAATLETSTIALLPFIEVSTEAALVVSRYAVRTNFTERFSPAGCKELSSGRT